MYTSVSPQDDRFLPWLSLGPFCWEMSNHEEMKWGGNGKVPMAQGNISVLAFDLLSGMQGWMLIA